MWTVRARRSDGPPIGSGVPLLGVVPAIGRAFLRVLAVVAILTGIVAMHSLGIGHGSMATSHSGPVGHSGYSGHSGHPGHRMVAGTTEMAETAASPAPLAIATGAEVAAEVDDPGHGMAAMCLAVLPLLVLVTARLLGWRVRSMTHAGRRQGVRGFVPGNRAPPALLCPSLLKLCILRT